MRNTLLTLLLVAIGALALVPALRGWSLRLIRALVMGFVVLFAGLAFGLEPLPLVAAAFGVAVLGLFRGGATKTVERPAAPLAPACPAFVASQDWRHFRDLVGRRDRDRADAAAATMAALLREAKDRSPLDPASEQARRIERDVPEYLRITLGRCQGATRAERTRYLASALARIDAIAERSRQERDRVRAADDQALRSYDSYLDETSARRPDAP